MAEPFRKDSGWAFRVDLGPDPASGKRRQVLRQGFATKRAASEAMNEVLGQVRTGLITDKNSVTVGVYLDDWVSRQHAHVRPTTLHGYRVAVGRICRGIGSMRLQALTTSGLDHLYAEMAQDLSPKSVANTHGVLRRALDDAVRTGLLVNNPAKAARPPRVTRPEFMTWSTDELRGFLDATRGERMYPLWVLLAATGMRRGEALGLRWSDVDLGRRRLSIVQTRTNAGAQEIIGTTKTQRSRRVVHLDEGTVAVLREHRKQQLEEQLACGDVYDSSHDLLFRDRIGRPVKPDLPTRAFREAVNRTSLPVIRLHDLRHTWATRALEAGVSPRVVADQLGHATVTITLDVYSHVTPSLARDVVDQVARGLFE